MSLIGAAICKLRELTGRKPVHDMKRTSWNRVQEIDGKLAVTKMPGSVRECARCGHTVPVKTRGPRKSKETQK